MQITPDTSGKIAEPRRGAAGREGGLEARGEGGVVDDVGDEVGGGGGLQRAEDGGGGEGGGELVGEGREAEEEGRVVCWEGYSCLGGAGGVLVGGWWEVCRVGRVGRVGRGVERGVARS